MVGQFSQAIAKAKAETDGLKKALRKKKEELADTTLDEAADDVTALARGGFKVKRSLKGHLSKIYAMHWAKDLPYLVSASQDGKLIVWNAQTNNKLAAIPLKSSWVMTCAFSPSGKLIASGGLDNMCTISQFKMRDTSNKIVSELSGHSGYLSCCRFLNDEQILSSSGDATCILWDITKSTPITTYADHENDVMGIALWQEKNIFASCSCDTLVKIWDIRTPKCIQTFFGHEGDINAVQFFPDGNSVATGSDDGSLRLFDLRYDGQLCKYTHESISGGITSLDFSRSGRLLFAGYDDYNCCVWDTLRAERVVVLAAHTNRVSCVGVSSDGYALCTGSWDGNLKIWARNV